MSSQPTPEIGLSAGAALPLQALQRIDAICLRFEATWRRGPRPALEEYVGEVPQEERVALLQELLKLDLHYRKKDGETPQLEDYQQRLPQFQQQLHHLLSLVHGYVRSAGGHAAPRTIPFTTLGCPSQFPAISGYEILDELGAGGMGIVYKARDLALKRLVAIKIVLSGGLAMLPSLQDRFRREAESLARLRHPHIVQVFAFGEHHGTPYFVMEYVDGGNLERNLRARLPSVNEAAGLALMLARAVEAAHQKGIVHRDLKPTNILLRSPLAALEPVIADFGLAKLLATEDAPDTGHTRTGTVLGTPVYMAPEQAEGQGAEVGPAADVYALGVILYRMMAGRLPNQTAATADRLRRVLLDSPEPPSREVPPALEAICLKCLGREPASRYPTAAALAEDLQGYLNQQADVDGNASLASPHRKGEGLGLRRGLRFAKRQAPLTPDLSPPSTGKRGVRTTGRSRVELWWRHGLAVAAVLTLVLVGVWQPWSGLRSLATNPNAPGTGGVSDLHIGGKINAAPAGKIAPFHGVIDLLVTEPGNSARQLLWLCEPAARPLKKGYEVRLDAQLEREAFLYVLWLDTRGQVNPAYPWRDGDWTQRPADETKTKHLSLPEDIGRSWEVEPGPAGMELLVLLARDTPLPHDVDLAQLLGKLEPLAVQHPLDVAWFENGQLKHDDPKRAVNFKYTKESQNPVLKTQAQLWQKLEPHFPHMSVVTFASLGG